MFGNKVSLSFTVTVFNLNSTEGDFFGKGDTSTLVCGSFKSIYSLKVKVILLLVTLVLYCLGDELTSFGAILSLGPPVGIPICAQPALLIATTYNNETIKMVKSIWLNFINGN